MQKLMGEGVSPMDAEIMSSLAWEGGFNPEKDNIHEHFKQFEDDDEEINNDFSHYLKNPKVVEAIQEYTRKPTPRMYEVHINAHPDHFLDWDKPMAAQTDYVKKAFLKAQAKGDPLLKELLDFSPEGLMMQGMMPEAKGAAAYKTIQADYGSDKTASDLLAKHGIKGIRYLDASSRGDTDTPTHNYVVFDHNHVAVKRKYARGGVVG